ncbi:MAG: hypothetical protein EOO11_11380 [Chitinophagaceae bacterium]|nr:MAG: hypothetical protein EOO11_11380 [Chitinophagaceae bacterium]
MRCFLVLSLLLLSLTASAAGSPGTRLPGPGPVGGRWTPYRSCLRLGVGTQRAFYAEAGIARHKWVYDPRVAASLAHYAALEWTPGRDARGREALYGVKAGVEASVDILQLGLEAKYATDGRRGDAVLTPRAGIGYLGLVQLCYGYHISFNGRPFAGIGRSQLSLVYVFNRISGKRARTGRD